MGEIFGITVPVPQSFLDPIIARIEEILKPVLGPIRAIVQIFTTFKTIVPDTIHAAEHLVRSVIDEYNGFKTFSFKQGGRTRVIQSVRGYEELSRLITKIPLEVVEKIKDLISIVKSRFEATETFSPEDIEGIEDLRSAVKKFGTKFGKAFEKVLGVLSLILDAFIAVKRTIDDLQTIVDDIREIRESVESLKGIVLPQDNKRVTVHLPDGSKIRRRVGHFFAGQIDDAHPVIGADQPA